METHWNSICDMVHWTLTVENELRTLLANRKEERYFKDTELHLLNKMYLTQSSLKMVSEFWLSSSEPILHLVLPFVILPNDACKFKDRDPSHIKELEKHLKEKGRITSNSRILIAWPRFSTLRASQSHYVQIVEMSIFLFSSVVFVFQGTMSK